MALDTSGWNIDHSQNPALYKMADTLQRAGERKQDMAMRREEINYRNQRTKEADDWRKLNLIQELSNIEKYQTGDSVADALGNMKAAAVLQKYTAAAGTMSPAELQYKISQDIQNTASGMQGFKDELTVFSKRLPELQKMYPSLSTKALEQKYREDVIDRRIENNEFVNPMHIEAPRINIDDPEVLADFIPEGYDKTIREEITNPKLSEDISVAMGNRDTYTKVKGKLPFYKKLNYKPEDIQLGFLRKGINPEMELKSQSEKFGNGTIETLSPDAFKDFSPSATLEMLKQAKQMPEWKNMSKEDKDKAVRHIALEYAKSDRSGFNFENANPPAARTNNYIGLGGGVGEARGNLIDKIDLSYYGNPQQGRIDNADIKIIPADLQAVLKSSGIDISGATTFQIEIENGKPIAITPEGGKRIDRVAIANAQKKFNTEGQKQVQPDFETTTPKVKQPDGGQQSYKLNGKTYTLDQVTKAAKQSGLTVEQYIKQAGFQ